MRRFALTFLAPPLLLLGLLVLPLALGDRTLYLRDITSAHLPLKVAQAEALRQGELPLVDLQRGGQPLLGNPNGLPLYPDNLLLLMADPLWVVNAHFWLHWLLAPLSLFWLGRSLGLSRPGAFSAGILFATGGYFFSLLNLYNLVTVAALVPAFLASGLDASAPRPEGTPVPAWRWPLFGLLFCLLLLAGDPFSALLGLFLLAGALLLRDGWRRALRPRLAMSLALLLGFLVSLPMWVEMLRILPASFRASISGVKSASLTQSLHPGLLTEGLFPLFFGRFDHSYWGGKLHDQGEPLIVSIFPGLLALVLLPLVFKAPRGLALRFGAAATLLGLVAALGRLNPLMVLFYELPGVGALRFPVKFLLLSAIGLAVLGGLACDRLLTGELWRKLRLYLGLCLVAYLGFFLLVLLAPAKIDALLLTFDPTLPAFMLELQRPRLGATALLLVAGAITMGLASLLARRSATLALTLLLLVQIGTQSLLLECLYESDDAAIYRQPPALAARLPEEARLVSAAFAGEAFGRQRFDPRTLPDLRQIWLARCNHEEMGAPTGIYFGREYELHYSPEGLDSYFSIFFGKGLEKRTDAERIRSLAGSGVDLVILPRALSEVDSTEAVLLERFKTDCHADVHVYRLEKAMPPFSLPGAVYRAQNAGDAAARLAAPGFNAREEAVLPARDGLTLPTLQRPPGQILELSEKREEIRATIDSAEGTTFTTRRAYLPIYRAEIDGKEAQPEVLNGHRLAVEIPPGRHQLHLYVDRQPTRIAFTIAALALFALLAWGIFAFRQGYR